MPVEETLTFLYSQLNEMLAKQAKHIIQHELNGLHDAVNEFTNRLDTSEDNLNHAINTIFKIDGVEVEA